MTPKLEARVKQEYKGGSVTAFSGREYVRSEWRPVPAGMEEQAKRNMLLEVRPVDEKRFVENTPISKQSVNEPIVETLSNDEVERNSSHSRRSRKSKDEE